MSTKRDEITETQRLAQAGILYAPAAFLNASVDELLSICNGCGSADSWFRPPKRIYGTLVVYACIIHDFMYEKGFTIDDKDEADRVFSNNMNRLITRDEHKLYKPTYLQRRRALKYYYAVKEFGGSAFWAGKTKLA